MRKQESCFRLIRRGEENQNGVVLGCDEKYWVVDTDSYNFLLQGMGDNLKNRLVNASLEYQAQANHPNTSLLFDDNGGQMFTLYQSRLKKMGYKVILLNSSQSDEAVDLACISLIESLTAVFVMDSSESTVKVIMERLIDYVTNRAPNNKLPKSVIFFLPYETAVRNELALAILQKRNIKFIIDTGNQTWPDWMYSFCDVKIQSLYPAGENGLVLLKRGYPPTKSLIGL